MYWVFYMTILLMLMHGQLRICFKLFVYNLQVQTIGWQSLSSLVSFENKNTCSQVSWLGLVMKLICGEQGLAGVCLAWTSLVLHLAKWADLTVDSMEQLPYEVLYNKGREGGSQRRKGRREGRREKSVVE